MRKFSCVFLLTICIQQAPCQLLLTEVHPTPAAGEPEWVELYNPLQTNVIAEEWKVCDDRSCASLPTFSVPAGGYCVVARDAVALREARWIPDHVTVVEAPLPSLNNTIDRVELRNGHGTVVDSVTYDVRRFIRGRSIERAGTDESTRVLYGNLWKACVDRDSATCGQANAALECSTDLRTASLELFEGGIAVTVTNDGRVEMRGRSIRVSCHGQERDTVIPPLQRGMAWSWFVDGQILGISDSVRQLLVSAVISGTDHRPRNDTLQKWFIVGPAPGRIMINEVLSDPNIGEADFIEIWNGTPHMVDFSGWVIEDASGTRITVQSFLRLAPDQFGVVSADTSIAHRVPPDRWTLAKPSVKVNSSADLVILRTPSGFAVDTAVIDGKNHHPLVPSKKGRSLEKKHRALPGTLSSSWTSSAALGGSTPGSANSVERSPSETSSVWAVPSPFSSDPYHPLGSTIIHWKVPFLQSVARISILRVRGTFVCDVVNSRFIAAEGSVAWSGTDALGARVERGPYVVVLECVDVETGSTFSARCVVVCGE